MAFSDKTDRRSFLGRVAGAAAAFSIAGSGQPAEAQGMSPDDWLKNVKATHRCLFDFPQHKNGMPLLHILNYLNTYAEAYKTGPGQAAAVGTFYSMGNQSSIALAFNDAMWAKYGLGEYLGLKDASGTPYTHNVFNRPTANDLHLVMQALQAPNIPAFAAEAPAIGIESLQRMGTTFLLCANALGGWCEELAVRGKGKAPDVMKELSANMLAGVVVVPAMVIAIEKAQGAGIAYNRQ